MEYVIRTYGRILHRGPAPKNATSIEEVRQDIERTAATLKRMGRLDGYYDAELISDDGGTLDEDIFIV